MAVWRISGIGHGGLRSGSYAPFTTLAFPHASTMRAVERTRSLSAPICALALLLLGVSSLFSGQMMIATGNSDNGLFIADYLTQDDLNYLAGKYPETLDKAVVLTAPDESRHLVRAATSHAYDCVTQHGSDDADCYSDSDNETTVMLVDSNSSLAGKTNDVHIAEGGNAGIILIDPTTQKITQAAQVPTEGHRLAAQ